MALAILHVPRARSSRTSTTLTISQLLSLTLGDCRVAKSASATADVVSDWRATGFAFQNVGGLENLVWAGCHRSRTLPVCPCLFFAMIRWQPRAPALPQAAGPVIGGWWIKRTR